MARRRLRPGVRRTVVAVAGAGMIAGLAYGSTFTWLFEAEEVRVEGEVRFTDAEVRSLAGLDVGANVFHLDGAAAEARLLADPRIATATVATDLPDLVTVRVVERIPVATAELDGAREVVADDGTILPEAPRDDLPEIAAVAGALDGTRRTAAAEVLAAMAPSLRRTVEVVYVGVGDDLTIGTVDGVTVTYGPPTEVGAKAEALRSVFAWSGSEGVPLVSVDVTVPSAPTARTMSGSVTPT